MIAMRRRSPAITGAAARTASCAEFLAALRPGGAFSDSRRDPAVVKVRPRSAATIDLNRRFLNPSSHVARVLLVSAASCVVVQARDARTSFNVSATVNAVAKLQVQSAPTEILGIGEARVDAMGVSVGDHDRIFRIEKNSTRVAAAFSASPAPFSQPLQELQARKPGRHIR